MDARRCDVLILGAGYSGSLAAAVLARKGYDVVLADRTSHPRFAVGESCTPEQTYGLDWLAGAYGIQALRPLSSYERLKHHGCPVPVWPKEAIYFLFNPAVFSGPRSEFMHQTHLWPFGPPYHCLRSEYDAYLLDAARACGADYRPDARLARADLSGPRARLSFEGPESFEAEARLVVDASGFGGEGLAQRLGLPVEEAPFGGLRTWSVFSHFEGVTAVEAGFGRDWPRLPIPRDNGTVHYVSPGGWAWVIPFDNGITSVGVTLYGRPPARTDDEARAAFDAFVAADPALSAALSGARPIRPFSRTGLLQRRVGASIGPNWVLLPPASGFTDPFFSPGNMVCTSSVARLAAKVDPVLKDGADARAVLGWMAGRHEAEAAHIARVIHSSYLAFRDPRLFERAQALYWLALSVERASVLPPPRDGGPELFAAHWGAGDAAFVAATREVERLLEDGRGDEAGAVAARVDEALRRADRWGLLALAQGRVKLTTLAHKRGLDRLRPAGAPAFAEGGPYAAVSHLLSVLATKPFEPRTPASAGSLRLLARHLRIALLGS